MRARGGNHEATPESSQLRQGRYGPAGARRRASQVLSAARNRLEPTVAGRVWRQLSELGFINSSLQFTAAFTLGFIPFLMLLSAALGPGLTRAIVTRSGFSGRAVHDLAMLFTQARTAPVTVLALVLAVLGGDAIALMVQSWYAKAFRAQIRGWKAIARRIQWLAGVLGFLALQAVIGRRIQPHGGDIAAAGAQFLLALVFWWWSLHALLGGQVPWRRLFPAGLATAVCYTGLSVYITYVMSSSIVANEAAYGPIGTVITLLAAETGLAVVLQLGTAIGASIGRRKDPDIYRPGRSKTPAD
jgi:membrane protein